MGIQRARQRGRKAFRRQPGNKPGRRVLIVCEGSATEPGYFEALKRKLKLGGMVIRGDEVGTAPINVVDDALAEKRRAQRAGEPFDSVWCVFDRDEHTSFAQAIDKARANGLKIAISIPCFEFWLLLHYEYTTRPFTDYNDIRRNNLSAHCPDYHKSKVNWDDVLTRLETAKVHAKRVRASQESGEQYPNPSTTVDLLVEHLESLVST
ncbi:RloB family protein [Haliangium sp.]|uniref:RloB family protein n=1 Tax=Haliangium sp. TaxID=2663208 RepID=UPI003D144DA6